MHKDFEELLSVFNAHGVRCLIIGGYAVSIHAQPRATRDIDILIGQDVANSEAVSAKNLEGIVDSRSPDFTCP